MSDGRKMAQASHASNAFIHETSLKKAAHKWASETKQGFGTAIVLAADLPTIDEVLQKVKSFKEVSANKVIDPEYGVKTTYELYQLFDLNRIDTNKTIINPDESVVFFKSEVTCAYVFGSKALLKPILGDLPLHP
jgi:hypothetical protein